MPISTRREFMLHSAGSAASLGLMLNGRWVPFESTELPRPASPNDRVGIGFIGFGIRGNILLEAARETRQVELVEVCDCYEGHLQRAKERTDGKIATNLAQYKKLLERKDIDAVIIATPDHWHLPIMLDALDAGKDVYIEKPMTHRIEDGPKMIAAAHRKQRIVQAGSQWVSSDQHKKAREIVASGKLGKVTKVTASYNRNSSTGSWNYPIPLDLKEGVNFNWTEWLGSCAESGLQSGARFSLPEILGLFGRYLHGPFRSPDHFHSFYFGRRYAEERGRQWRNFLSP